MKNRKKIGNEYEKKLCELLNENGYWCHNFSYGLNGQPCDIIAMKGKDKQFLIDVKHCEKNFFSFSRIEPNQRGCFNFAKHCGITNVGFVIWFENENAFKWLSFEKLELLEKLNVTSVSSNYLKEFREII